MYQSTIALVGGVEIAVEPEKISELTYLTIAFRDGSPGVTVAATTVEVAGLIDSLGHSLGYIREQAPDPTHQGSRREGNLGLPPDREPAPGRALLEVCPSCKGAGMVQVGWDSRRRCEMCSGSGVVRHVGAGK